MPTITDANLLLGRLNAKLFLGGEIALDLEARRAAVTARCGQPLGLDTVQPMGLRGAAARPGRNQIGSHINAERQA
jgi:N-methylhydantoinase A/oxoprolinase/acetone carboxylase beta subunit